MMKLPLVLCALALAPSARANPMLDLCLPLAPKACALTADSPQDDYLKCFEDVMLSASKSKERACASELLHAKLHKACAQDIPALCADVKPGENRTMSCLRRSRAKLTKPCSGAYDEYRKLEDAGAKKGGRKKGGGVAAVRC